MMHPRNLKFENGVPAGVDIILHPKAIMGMHRCPERPRNWTMNTTMDFVGIHELR